MNQPIYLSKFLFSVIKPYKGYIVCLIFVALYWGFNTAVAPYVLKLIIDTAVANAGDKANLVAAIQPYVLLYIGLWIAIAVDMRFLDWVHLRLFPSIRKDIITNMFSYLNQHSYRYFQNNFAGSLSNKIFDLQAGTVTILQTLDAATAQFFGLIAAIITMLLVHPIFGLTLFLWAISFLSFSYYFYPSIRDLSNEFAGSKTIAVGKIVDSISNIINVRLFSRNPYENQIVDESIQDTVNKDRRMQWKILGMHVFWDVSIIVLIGINIVILVHMYQKNLVSVGDFSFIISLSMSIFYNLWWLATQFVTFTEEAGKCKQALTVIEEPLELVDKPDAKPIVVTKGEIEFNDVSFHYGEGSHLFRNKNILIQPGQKVGLVGYSGSGKSSFVNLILRLFDVESGAITIDGQNIAEVTQNSLREHISMIPQDTSLFHRSLMDNIRYGRLDASDEDVIEAAKKAHCHEFIVELTEGYQSLVGERGVKLSGGQRQRIAIARALLKNAPILILDEATSALDSVTERLIQEGLHRLMQGKTTIVIAHRLSTLSEMDRILVFDDGHVIEDGTHEQLIKSKGHYAHMWQMQANGFLPESQE